MIDFRIVIFFLPASGRKKHLSDSFSPKYIDEFSNIIERSVIKYAFNQQSIADVLLFSLRRVPKEAFVLFYDLLS